MSFKWLLFVISDVSFSLGFVSIKYYACNYVDHYIKALTNVFAANFYFCLAVSVCHVHTF